MEYFLSEAARPVLRKVAREKTLCAFDFDGTLAPIVSHPDLAGMRQSTSELLASLASLFPCIILSGRARADVLQLLAGMKLDRVIGNHGAEKDAASGGRIHQRIQGWKTILEAHLGETPGLWIEDKGLSLAVHYRQASNKVEARKRILQASKHLDHVRVFGGKQVINLVQEDAPNKGVALANERERLGCRWVLFVGDDANDEDAFALKGNVVPVRVGRKRDSHARYYIRSQGEIDTLLQLMVSLRRNSQSSNLDS